MFILDRSVYTGPLIGVALFSFSCFSDKIADLRRCLRFKTEALPAGDDSRGESLAS